MSSKARKQVKQRHDDSDSPRSPAGPPLKRVMTSKSPEPITSIFGGGTSAATTLAAEASSATDTAGQCAGARGLAAVMAGGSCGTTPKSPTTATVEKIADSEERPIDRASLFSERIVTILVGPAAVTWRLHENLLSSASDFFRSAFNSGFKESFEDRLLLPEDDPHCFELFVRWLYARATAAPPDNPAARPPLATSLLFGGSQCIQTYLRLYVLASKLLVEELENICVDEVSRYYKVGTRRPDVRDVQYIYDNTVPGAGMRSLMRERLTLGLFRGRQNNPVTAEWREILNETPDLGFDIVNEVSSYHWISGGNAPARTVSEECVFHRHEKGEFCRPGCDR